MRLTIAALFAGLVVGIALGATWPDPGPSRQEITARVERAITARTHAIRTVCAPIRSSPNRLRCIAVRFQSQLGYGGQVYVAKVNWETGRFRFRRFDIPIEWGV